jgi:hypothetical protein
MKYLVIFACVFGCLLIDPAALAQNKFSWGGSKPDNKYGEGGTEEIDQDINGKVSTKWRDKDGNLREEYIHPNEGDKTSLGSWSFYNKDHEMVGKFSWQGKQFWAGEILRNVDTDKQEALRLIEKIEKQVAKDGTIPRDLFEKEVDSKLEQEKPKKEDTKVKPPDLAKQRQTFFSTAEEAKADAQKRAEVKAQCDGIREKIRTLQDLLRKRQAEPASPKPDLETIRKQIDDLLSQLADCPKQEPIDVQFDCLKSKFPEARHLVTSPILAVDPTSKREFAWDKDKQAWIDEDTKESICPPSGIDPCLVGTWKCTSFREANNNYFTGGGTGFRVTFSKDGIETIDYSSMQPTKLGPHDTIGFIGKASAKISTDKSVAKIEAMQNASVSMTFNFFHANPTMKYPGLGPGGLGSPENKNNYKCTEDSLEYESSYQHGQYTCTLKFTKVKAPP